MLVLHKWEVMRKFLWIWNKFVKKKLFRLSTYFFSEESPLSWLSKTLLISVLVSIFIRIWKFFWVTFYFGGHLACCLTAHLIVSETYPKTLATQWSSKCKTEGRSRYDMFIHILRVQLKIRQDGLTTWNMAWWYVMVTSHESYRLLIKRLHESLRHF